MSDSPQIAEQQQAPPPPPAEAPNNYAPRLPAAVQRANERANELAAQMLAEADAERQQEQEQGQEQREDGAASAEPSQQQQQPAPPREDTAWESRYRTLKGKYDAEVPQLRGQVQNLEHLIATMHNAPAARAPEPEPQHRADPEVEIPETDLETYGADFVDSARRWARAELAPEVRQLRGQVSEIREHQQMSDAERVRERVKAELDNDPELTGRWQMLNHDEDFIAWLQAPDPFSGARRQDLLRHAYANGDSLRTGIFFKSYLAEQTTQRGYPEPYPPQTPSARNGRGAGPVDLASYAAPGRVANATPGPGAQAQRIWSNQDIRAFFDARMKGRYRGREAEADRLERDILAASVEGRIAK